MQNRVSTIILKLWFLAAIYFPLVVSAQTVLQDPTRPPSASDATHYVAPKAVGRPRWSLSSTLVSTERRTAVINNKVVSQGDRVNGATVVSIDSSSVRLRAGGREITLVMYKNDFKSLSQTVVPRQGK